jgi:hypothetical protein
LNALQLALWLAVFSGGEPATSDDRPVVAPPTGAASPAAPPLAADATGTLGLQDQVAPEKSLWERLKFDASGRLRGESTFDQLDGTDRHRGRFRLRVGAQYEVLETLKAHARLTTVSDDRDSNNAYWDFGDGPDGSSSAEVGMDRFYMDWAALPDLSLRAGKQPYTFTQPPVYSEFAWDQDVHPGGLAAVWAPQSDGALRYDLRLAEYVAVEIGNDADPSMFGVQGNLYLDTSDTTHLQLAASYSDWANLDAGPGVGNQGNTDVFGDFDVLEGFLAATYDGGPLDRTTGFVQYMENLDGDDSGISVGAQLGKSGKKGDANVFAAWYDFDADAFFSPVAQDDTPIAGTGTGEGMDGILAGGQYFITDQLSLRLWGLTSDAGEDEDPYRVRLDIDFTIR